MFRLLEELRKFSPYDENERKNVEKVLSFLVNSENCYDRSNLEGHVTAGGLICDKEGNLLLNHHKALNMWLQFGGHSDGSGDSLSVAKREILEEAGITELKLLSDKIFDVDVQVIPENLKKKEPQHFHYDINFLFLVDSDKFQMSDESDDIKWVSLEKAKILIRPIDTGLKRMFEKVELVLQTMKNQEM